MADNNVGIRINGQGPFDSQLDKPFDNQRSLFHIVEGQRSSYEPARSTDFELFVYGLEDLVDGVDNEKDVTEAIRIAVAKAPVPHFSINVLEQRRGNTVQKFAGTPTFQAGQIELYDWIGLNTKSILTAWQAKACQLIKKGDQQYGTGKTGVLSDYKKTATLVEYTPDGQKVRSWKMYGCWISSIDEDAFDHSNQQSERRIRATMEYDLAIPEDETP